MDDTSGVDERRGGGALRIGVTTAISAALFDELADAGYAGTSMEAVARRAGVGKAALYRRWSSKESMVLSLIGDTVRSHLLETPDTGRLDSDLRTIMTGLRTQLGHPAVARIAPGLLAQATADDGFRQSLWTAVAEPRRNLVADVLSTAVNRRELPADFDIELGCDLVIAPLALRLLIMHRPFDDHYFEALLSALGAALRVAH